MDMDFLNGIAPKAPPPMPVIDPTTPIPATRIKYLSPTSLSAFYSGRDTFVLNYIIGGKRMPQTQAMALGSAFDARVKGYLADTLLGRKGEFDRLFESSVEAQVRDWALEHSGTVFERYTSSGALGELLFELTHAREGYFQYEFSALREITFPDGTMVPISGKPDLYFITKDHLNVVLDWKVTGYMSQASPMPGYVRGIREDGTTLGAHPKASVVDLQGFKINPFTTLKTAWETQLGMYQLMIDAPQTAWLCGIEMLSFTSDRKMVTTSYRTQLSNFYMSALLDRIQKAWSFIRAQHYYPDRSKEESDARVRLLLAMSPMQLQRLI